MTVHDMTLPGHIGQPNEPYCRGRSCRIRISQPAPGDTPAAWHAAVDQGRQAIEQYLRRYNRDANHATQCQYRNLPPSIHLWARTFRDEEVRLETERRSLPDGVG